MTLEKKVPTNISIILFLDVTQVYQSVDHEALLEIMERYGIRRQLLIDMVQVITNTGRTKSVDNRRI